jgi:hypothetical protein
MVRIECLYVGKGIIVEYATSCVLGGVENAWITSLSRFWCVLSANDVKWVRDVRKASDCIKTDVRRVGICVCVDGVKGIEV